MFEPFPKIKPNQCSIPQGALYVTLYFLCGTKWKRSYGRNGEARRKEQRSGDSGQTDIVLEHLSAHL